jgi:hypothetical protein
MTDQFDLAQLMYEQPAADVTPLSLADINELLELRRAQTDADSMARSQRR